MLENYLIIHKSILPDYYEKVLEARRLLEKGRAKDVSAAVKMVGISRSTYYKYKDYILEPSDVGSGRNAVFAFLLTHETGILGTVLMKISEAGGSILTITQSLPIHDLASVTLSVDISGLKCSVEELISSISSVQGVENPKLIAIE